MFSPFHASRTFSTDNSRRGDFQGCEWVSKQRAETRRLSCLYLSTIIFKQYTKIESTSSRQSGEGKERDKADNHGDVISNSPKRALDIIKVCYTKYIRIKSK